MPVQTFHSTMEQLLLLIRAGCPLIYLVTYEEMRALDCVARLVRVLRHERKSKGLFCWAAGEGLCEVLALVPPPPPEPNKERDWLKVPGQGSDMVRVGFDKPLDALLTVLTAGADKLPAASDCVAVFLDAHLWLMRNRQSGDDGSLVRPLRKAAAELRKRNDELAALSPVLDPSNAGNSKTLIIVAPSDDGLSPELERDLIKIHLPLPEQSELVGILSAWIGDRSVTFEPVNGVVPPPQEQSKLLAQIAAAGRGLTQNDYQLGLNKIRARGQQLGAKHVEDMLDLKAQVISNRALTYTPHVDVELGGLQKVKAWVHSRRDAAVSADVRQRFQLPPPRGVMLCGASGGGKSRLAMLIAMEFNLALLRLDVGSLFGSYQGESEQRTREALEMAQVLSPVVLWIDELDKAFHGVGGGGDNGVSARVLGYLLTWLSEKQDTVFVVATANDHRALLRRFPEFGRKGRFDQIFWVPLPTPAQRAEIFAVYLKEVEKRGGDVLLELDNRAIDAEAAKLRRRSALPGSGAPIDRLASLLSDGQISEAMTGAEIENAFTVAKTELYASWQANGSPSGKHTLTVEGLVNAIKAGKEQATFRPGSPALVEHDDAQADAVNRGWTLCQ